MLTDEHVFGDTNDLASLHERLYQYRQARGESLVDCSLKLVDLFSRITERHSTYETRKNQTVNNDSVIAALISEVSWYRRERQLHFFQVGTTFALPVLQHTNPDSRCCWQRSWSCSGPLYSVYRMPTSVWWDTWSTVAASRDKFVVPKYHEKKQRVNSQPHYCRQNVKNRQFSTERKVAMPLRVLLDD